MWFTKYYLYYPEINKNIPDYRINHLSTNIEHAQTKHNCALENVSI